MTRVGASQVFFNVVAGFNARKLIHDHNATMTVMKAVTLDSFEAMLKPVEDLTRGIGLYMDAVKDVAVEMGQAQVEFEKFYDAMPAKQQAMAEELKEIGLAFGMVGTEALAAGSRAAQVAALVGNENIPLLVEQAEILAQISDLTSEEAMKGIIKLQQQTGVLYGNLNQEQFNRLSQLEKEAVLTRNSARALDALNTIANRSVAVEGELVEVMTNFSAQGALVGETFEDMAAMSAVLLEAGEEAGAAGRALRMTYARLGGDIGGARTKLEEMGIQIKDEEGNLLTLTQIIQNLVDMGWNRFTPALKQNIAQTIAGNRHYVRFIKLMENQGRAVQLAKDGMAGFDSASEQAATAMQALANQMIKAEAESENLKASLGENLLPFQIGAQEAKNDLLEMQVSISNMFGEGFGKAIGRMSAFMQHMGGFVKFGLGVQTMSIGMQMFDAVQRDLHGILIANENLHSKQATHLAFGAKATEEQEYFLKKIRFQYQKINALREKEAALRLEQLKVERDLQRMGGESSVQIEERMVQLNQENLDISKKLSDVSLQRHGLMDKRLTIQSAIDRALQGNVGLQGTELDLLQKYYQIKNATTVQDHAYRKMVIIQQKTMSNLSDDEVRAIRDKNRELDLQHTKYQQIIEENERIRLIQLERGTRGSKKQESVAGATVNEAANKAFIESYGQIEQAASKYRAELNRLVSNIDNLDEAEQARMAEIENKILPGYNNLRDAYEELTEKDGQYLVINKQGLAVLRNLNSDLIGHRVHIEKAMSQKEIFNDINREHNELMKLQQQITEDNNLELDDLMNLLPRIVASEREREEILKDIARIQDEELKQTQLRGKLEQKVAGKIKANRGEQLQFAEMQKQKTDELLFTTKQGIQRLGMAASGVGSVLMGMFGDGKNSAFASTLLMTSSLGPAVGALTTATKQFAATQMKAVAALRAGEISAAGFVGNIAKALGPLAAISAALYVFNSRQEQAGIALASSQKLLDDHNQTMALLKTQTNLFSDENAGLAEKLGINNYSLKELHENGDLLDTTLVDLKDGYHGLDASQEAAIDSAIRLAEALKGINAVGEGGVIDSEQLKITFQEMDELFDGMIDESINTFDEAKLRTGLFIKESRIEGAKQLEESGIFSEDAMSKHYLRAFGKKKFMGVDVDIELMLTELQTYFEKGNRLTKEEMSALVDLLDNPELSQAIKNINDAIITTETEIFNPEDVAQEQESISKLGSDIKNLTEDIYNFGSAREELFFGGKYGNVTGSLYKQVVKQGVGTLYNKMDIVMTNNFNGFFNEEEAAQRIINVLNEVAPSLTTQ
jgi:TP901 family phage tail tape measure protein